MEAEEESPAPFGMFPENKKSHPSIIFPFL